jgi:hypothetical protein
MQHHQLPGKWDSKSQRDTTFQPNGMVIIKKTDNIKCWQGCNKITNLTHCQRDRKQIQTPSQLFNSAIAAVSMHTGKCS